MSVHGIVSDIAWSRASSEVLHEADGNSSEDGCWWWLYHNVNVLNAADLCTYHLLFFFLNLIFGSNFLKIKLN